MLHEILLSLAGGPSPLLSCAPDNADNDSGVLQSLLSPAEQALLRSLAQDLGERNKNIRSGASNISASHPSMACRAVATTIISTHLASFQRRILEVEREILSGDARIVGAYNIVPLSGLVGAFDGWARKLDWLWSLVQYMRAPKRADNISPIQSRPESCTAAEVIAYLRDSTHTGYPDIEVMSLELVKTAESAWLKELSAWVLYGRHPAHGAADFFVARKADSSNGTGLIDVYDIKESLIPPFVTQATAQSILFIGKSLNHIRERQSLFKTGSSKALAPELALLPNHLAYLSSLEYPLSPSSFSAAIGAIRLSLSQNALRKLLPISQVLDMLQLLKDFFLLGRGEFAIALITSADERLSSRSKNDRSKQSIVNDLASMTIKEGEVSAVLARTWASLASLQSLDDEDVDEGLDQARELMRLSIKSLDTSPKNLRDPNAKPAAASFDDLLLPSSTVLSLRVPSPLDLFLTPSDVDAYSNMHAYLLALRRAHLRLSRLFLLSVLRRDHPSPRVPTSSSHHEAFETLARIRTKAEQRTKTMRPIWATIGSATFFLAEVGEYFQGEVVQSSWSTFYTWLLPNLVHDTRSGDISLISSISSAGRLNSRPPSSRSAQDSALYSPHDPETLTQAHRSYLRSLKSTLLLEDAEFTILLRRFMTSIDHLSALMQRLNTIQQTLGSETNTGVGHSANHFASEEHRVMEDLRTSRLKVASGVQSLIESLRTIDAARTNGRQYKGSNRTTEHDGFVPWTGGGLDRLLLKFDYGNVEKLAEQQPFNG